MVLCVQILKCVFTDVFPKMAVFSHKQPFGLHLQLQPLNGLDHGVRCKQLVGRATEAVQLPPSGVGAERHLLLGGSFRHTELVVAAHHNGHSIHYKENRERTYDDMSIYMHAYLANKTNIACKKWNPVLPVATSVFTLKSSGVST